MALKSYVAFFLSFFVVFFVVLLGYGFSFVHDNCHITFERWGIQCEGNPAFADICEGVSGENGLCTITCSHAVYEPWGGVDANGNFLPNVRIQGPPFGDDCLTACSDFEYSQEYACNCNYEYGGSCSMCCTLGQAGGDPLPDCPEGKAYYQGSSECSCPPDGSFNCSMISQVAGVTLTEWDAETCFCKCINDTVTDIWLDQDCENEVGSYCWQASYYDYNEETGYNATFNPEYGKLWYYNPPECDPENPPPGGCGGVTRFYLFKPLDYLARFNIWDVLVPSAYAQSGPELYWDNYGDYDYDLIQDVSSSLGGCGTWENVGVTHVDNSYLYEFNFYSGCYLVYVTKVVSPYCLGGCDLQIDSSSVDSFYDVLSTKFPFSVLLYVKDTISDLMSIEYAIPEFQIYDAYTVSLNIGELDWLRWCELLGVVGGIAMFIVRYIL
jgi:hypothetical protein